MQWLYEQRENRYIPGDLVAGPWASGTQNGAMVAGLLGQVLEETPARAPMIPMSVHIEILKPIPLQELAIERSLARDGRTLQVVQATLLAGGTAVALATMVRLRADTSAARTRSPHSPRRCPPHGMAALEGRGPFFEFIECRAYDNGFDELGPGAAWFRPRGQIIAGRPCSPLGAAMLCADAGSGLPALVPRTEWAYPNVSLALHSHRAPRGEWLLLESETISEVGEIAQVNSTFSDLEGPFGSVHQAVLIQRQQNGVTTAYGSDLHSNIP